MRLVVVGGTGTIGRAVCEILRDQHEVIAVGHRHGDHTVDIKDTQSINFLKALAISMALCVRRAKFILATLRNSATAKCASV
jgi:uncharacterized protein YbjT (DUF2867 family)